MIVHYALETRATDHRRPSRDRRERLGTAGVPHARGRSDRLFEETVDRFPYESCEALAWRSSVEQRFVLRLSRRDGDTS
jgi:hypothetical protein